jgi:hypothetical protein
LARAPDDRDGDEAQERRLAGAVAANQADLVSSRIPGGDSVQDQRAFDAVGDVVDVQHGREAIAEARGFVTVQLRLVVSQFQTDCCSRKADVV